MISYKYVTVQGPERVTYLAHDWPQVTGFLAEKGCVAQEVDSFRLEMLHQLQARLVQPRSRDLWQAPSFCLPNVPRAAAEALMKDMDCQLDTPSKCKWICRSPEKMWQCCRGLSRIHKECMGQSKALGKGKRHPWHRAVATIIQFEASHSKRKNGRQLLYVNALYVLMLESGELVKPRTSDKVPIVLTEEEEGRVRHAILRDLRLMALKPLCLSSKLLSMLGEKWEKSAAIVAREEESLLTEAADLAEQAELEDWRRDACDAGENWDEVEEEDLAQIDCLPSPPRSEASEVEAAAPLASVEPVLVD